MDRRVVVTVAVVGLVVLVGVAAGSSHGAGADVGPSATTSVGSDEPIAATSVDSDGPLAVASASETGNGSVCVVLFYSETCPHCDNVEEYLADVRESHDVTVKQYVVQSNAALFQDYLEAYDVPANSQGKVPTVFVGADYAVGDDPAIALIEAKLDAGRPIECPSEDLIEKGMAPVSTDAGSGPNGTDGTSVSSDGLGQCDETDAGSDDGDACGADDGGETELKTVAGLAGLAASDSVNPCALAVLLVLLTTISARAEGSGRTVLAAGLSFASAIFLTYFAMGVLLIQGLRSVVAATTGTIDGLYALVGGLAILLGLLNLKDWYAHGAGGFVIEVPFSWRPTMQRYLTRPLWERGSVVVGAFIAGVAVSAFLLPCTSGPYFVAGGILADLPWSRSLPLLAAYNLVFVLPMVGVTAVIAGGFVSVERISNWREENVERLHLVAGLVLLAIGVWMLLSSATVGDRLPETLTNPVVETVIAPLASGVV